LPQRLVGIPQLVDPLFSNKVRYFSVDFELWLCEHGVMPPGGSYLNVAESIQRTLKRCGFDG
jgi:hypothetical protein